MTVTTTTLLAAALLIAVCLAAAFALAFFRLRRRHRDLRHTLARVAHERDEARWELRGGPRPVPADAA